MSQLGETPDQGGIEQQKRQRRLSRKALQNAVEKKRHEIGILHKRLLRVIQSAEGPDDGTNIVLRDLTTASKEFHGVLQELFSLYEQDVYGDFGEEALLTNESLTLKRAYILIDQIKRRKSDTLLETSSRRSRHSSRHSKSCRSSSLSSTASSARIKALAEAAAARESAEYERLIAEKEHERRKREAEMERSREQEKAQYEKDLAFLSAKKKVAVADAKLKAIEQAITEEEIGENCELPDIPNAKPEERVQQWVHTTPAPEASPTEITQTNEAKNLPKQYVPLPQFPETRVTKSAGTVNENHDSTRRVSSQHPFIASTPIRNVSGSQLLKA